MPSNSLPILYHVPTACSEACITAFKLCGISYTTNTVDYSTKKLDDGNSLLNKNPLGQVSTLELNDGRIITENVAILLWANENDKNGLSIKPEDEDYYELVKWLSFCANELHKLILWPLVRPDIPLEYKAYLTPYIMTRLDILETELSSRSFIVPDRLSVADAYLAWFIGFFSHLMPEAVAGRSVLKTYETLIKDSIV